MRAVYEWKIWDGSALPVSPFEVFFLRLDSVVGFYSGGFRTSSDSS